MNQELTKSTKSFARLRNSLAVCFIAFNFVFLIPPAQAEEAPVSEITTIVTNGGDDTSYRIPLTVPVVYDGNTYENVYATTNSVITFGRADGTYWDYPQTPSISIESRDWWALPYQMPDTHFIINVSDGGFQVDGAYRPYGTWTGDVTTIVVTAQIQTDGTVAYTYNVVGPLLGGERTGARLADGTVVTLEEAGVTQVEEVPVLEPEPTPPPEELQPSPVEPEPQPQPQPEPPRVVPVPVQPDPVQPEVEPVPVEPVPVEPSPEPEVVPVPEPQPEPETPVIDTPEENSSEESITLDNGVVLTASQATAVTLLQNPAELLQEIFTNPAAALAALGQVGADMSPEVREQSEKVVVAAVIVGSIANAAGAAAYRRKP